MRATRSPLAVPPESEPLKDPMKRIHRIAVPSLLGLAGLALLSAFAGPGSHRAKSYEVTVTNLTPGQLFTPVIVAAHDQSVQLFQAGGTASPGLQELAEEGDPSILAGELSAEDGVSGIQTGAGMIFPGMSETLRLDTDGRGRYFSYAAMLASTNDAFGAVTDVPLPNGVDEVVYYAPAYDAGTEYNSEECQYIPGPPCGSAGQHDPRTAEGFIAIHNGIHGIGDLDASTMDWRNPVAEIRIKRVR